MQYDEPPLRQYFRLAVATQRMIASEMAAHVAHHHLPPRRRDPVQALPHADESIPDVDLAGMVNLLETDEYDIAQVAQLFDYPLTLVERELADYAARCRREFRGRAGAP